MQMGIPQAGDPAPARFFLYDLRNVFWYRTAPDAREATERSFFDLVGCSEPEAVPPTVELWRAP